MRAVVVGSGIGGSAATLLLANAGIPVTLVEKNRRLGGSCSGYDKQGFHVDIGTHMSLVQRANGRFVVVDGCALDDAQREAVMSLTGNGERVDAVVHVHPFHTLHVEATHRLFPSATARHPRHAA